MLPDPNFARTVVLVCEHSEEGALGLVLNRAGELRVADSAPEIAELTGGEATIDAGGPVQTDALLVLAEFEDVSDAALAILDTVGLIGDSPDIDELAGTTRRARVRGLRGLGPGTAGRRAGA